MAVGHINFRKPIEVGGIALFNSQVCYSSDRFMQISVETQVLDVETQNCEVGLTFVSYTIHKLQITNTFQFTFKSDHEVPLVVPKSYADGILYLDARRHFSRSAHLEP
jgi:acyl-coenzyme A thioesterase 9